MSTFNVRSKPHNVNREKEFKGGRVSIGWPCGQELIGLKRSELEDALTKRYPDITAHSISQVDQFLNIRKDNLILTPSEENKANIHIFRAIDGPHYDKTRDNNDDGDPHGVSVKHLKTVKRSLLPAGVFNSLKGALKTVCNFSKHSSAMEKFIEVAEGISDETVTSELELHDKVRNILIKSLDSDNELVRVHAASALYQLI
jgi:hypothetical protein